MNSEPAELDIGAKRFRDEIQPELDEIRESDREWRRQWFWEREQRRPTLGPSVDVVGEQSFPESFRLLRKVVAGLRGLQPKGKIVVETRDESDQATPTVSVWVESVEASAYALTSPLKVGYLRKRDALALFESLASDTREIPVRLGIWLDRVCKPADRSSVTIVGGLEPYSSTRADVGQT